jgi:hypothetical protein
VGRPPGCLRVSDRPPCQGVASLSGEFADLHSVKPQPIGQRGQLKTPLCSGSAVESLCPLSEILNSENYLDSGTDPFATI